MKWPVCNPYLNPIGHVKQSASLQQCSITLVYNAFILWKLEIGTQTKHLKKIIIKELRLSKTRLAVLQGACDFVKEWNGGSVLLESVGNECCSVKPESQSMLWKSSSSRREKKAGIGRFLDIHGMVYSFPTKTLTQSAVILATDAVRNDDDPIRFRCLRTPGIPIVGFISKTHIARGIWEDCGVTISARRGRIMEGRSGYLCMKERNRIIRSSITSRLCVILHRKTEKNAIE
ncbi:hypothetical protein Trydic_g12798 [Trypoxylus dichotomus]